MSSKKFHFNSIIIFKISWFYSHSSLFKMAKHKRQKSEFIITDTLKKFTQNLTSSLVLLCNNVIKLFFFNFFFLFSIFCLNLNRYILYPQPFKTFICWFIFFIIQVFFVWCFHSLLYYPLKNITSVHKHKLKMIVSHFIFKWQIKGKFYFSLKLYCLGPDLSVVSVLIKYVAFRSFHSYNVQFKNFKNWKTR